MPPYTGTKKVNRKCSFFQRGGRKPKVRDFIYPLDTTYQVGCNDDLISTTSTLTKDDLTEAREKQQATRQWHLKQSLETSKLMSQGRVAESEV